LDAESRVSQLEAKLSASESEKETLRKRTTDLESQATEARRELEAARARVRELEAAGAGSTTQEQPSEPASAA
jgi:TolA-binding protein